MTHAGTDGMGKCPDQPYTLDQMTVLANAPNGSKKVFKERRLGDHVLVGRGFDISTSKGADWWWARQCWNG
jgi:hypothetical protein